jgi:hypothetical protein
MSSEQGFPNVPGVPEGWELVALRGPCEGDWFIGIDGKPHQTEHNSGQVWPIIRKIEKPAKYRAFANAEEFRPHRDRWWRIKGDATEYPPQHYNDAGFCGCTWQQAFNKRIFDDGTPFGVKIDE